MIQDRSYVVCHESKQKYVKAKYIKIQKLKSKLDNI